MRIPCSARIVALFISVAGASALVAAARIAPPAHPSSEALPKVRLIATGGTISNHPAGRLTANDLLKTVPVLAQYVRAEAEQFANTSSSALTLGQWRDLARRINTVLRSEVDLAGIVVSSGTDTLEEIAYFLNLTVKSSKPVVLVGAMRDPSAVGYDGLANLLAAFRVAAEPASAGKGVLVVLNDEINAARDVSKTDALRLDTFQSRRYGVLGVADRDRVVYYRTPLKRHTAATEFDLSNIGDLPRVDIVLAYQGAEGDLIRALVDAGTRGIVIASAGAGAISASQRDAVQYATSKGVVVVTSTRTGSGRIAARQGTRDGAPGRQQPNRIAAEDLSPLKARILLMLALTRTSDGATIQRMFTEY